jgi:hypothetical protein
MGKLIRQKQEAGELATQEDGRPISVPDGNTYQTLPDIGVTRKESSTSKKWQDRKTFQSRRRYFS